MLSLELLNQVFKNTPTDQQIQLFSQLDMFLQNKENESLFILRGYAGTGKTTCISALVNLLPKYKLKPVLLAPTGRAAKVISNYSGKTALTIHKRIYKKSDNLSASSSFELSKNNNADTVFIIDEASMITNMSSDFNSSFGQNLLDDLIKYVFNNNNCKLIFVGDTAQLPPIGLNTSPALDADYLSSRYNFNIYEYELTDVIRQQQESGILENATSLRDLISYEIDDIPKFKTKGFKDIYKMTGERMIDGLNYAYDKYGIEDTLVITRSNKAANNFNQQIRNRVLFKEDEISSGDYLMIVKNNYYWTALDKSEEETKNKRSFIANGDLAKIKRIRGFSEMYNCRFAEVVLHFPDYEALGDLTCKIMLDVISDDTPNLSSEKSKKLYEAIQEEYSHITDNKQRFEAIKNDPYFNALQVKFAYAVTCHKAQGGQWSAVFIDQGYLTEDMINLDYLRWLYTAVTRASKELFFVNFNNKFYE